MIGSKTSAKRPQYEQAATWAADTHGALRASRRTAWIIAAVAAGVAGLEAIALAGLMPLKSVVPYTLVVDRQTGYVEQIRGLQPTAQPQDQAITESFLAQYVLARETFDATDLNENYRKVMLWSEGAARGDYQALMQKNNPNSPLAQYPPSTVVQTTIKSISLLSQTTALVRFDTTRRDAGGATIEQRPWAAVMSFRYTGAPMRMGDRFTNPLGFQVTRYRRDAETTGAVARVTSPAAGVLP